MVICVEDYSHMTLATKPAKQAPFASCPVGASLATHS